MKLEQKLLNAYSELLTDAKAVNRGSVEDERIDAKLCLLEQLMEEDGGEAN